MIGEREHQARRKQAAEANEAKVGAAGSTRARALTNPCMPLQPFVDRGVHRRLSPWPGGLILRWWCGRSRPPPILYPWQVAVHGVSARIQKRPPTRPACISPSAVRRLGNRRELFPLLGLAHVPSAPPPKGRLRNLLWPPAGPPPKGGQAGLPGCWKLPNVTYTMVWRP